MCKIFFKEEEPLKQQEEETLEAVTQQPKIVATRVGADGGLASVSSAKAIRNMNDTHKWK